MEPTVYPSPNHPNVRLWDLPGIGAPDFQPTTYLRQVNFKRYDFFVIIASERFKCNHAALAREIEKMGKRFYFVRSKVDEDLRNEERDHPRTFSQESVLERLRMDCRKHLQKAGMSNPEIFLLSNCEFTNILLASMIGFYKYFGLDDRSLANLARQAGKPIAELKAVIISPRAEEINRDVVIKLLLKEEKGLPRLTANLPVLGPMLTVGISFLTTYLMLLSFLCGMAEDAERVRKTALKEDKKKHK
ncbi:hypothetical protein KIL84_005661 [Mauremys mutica]|uniref:IRG-type G domain-containing protein n=1 Tax=Mauremys mutica TaxID=74926 RepID=A0A9D4B403_9SAUR|nr:hypothetical protein KIL84_005661 [Mauremys mutica]